MKNRVWQTFLLVFLVVVALLALFHLPRVNLFGKDLRRVNILSDVQRRNEQGKVLAEVLADSLDGYVEQRIDSAAIKVTELAYVDSVPEGMTAIEDYADPQGIHREMDHFYAALDAASHRPVRVAYFGDSYIEGDILTADLRGLLQQKYGGRGVGFVEIQCVSSDFRQSVITRRNGWRTFHANEQGRGFKNDLQGVAGSYFIPVGTATFEARGQRRIYGALLDTAEVATVFFTPGRGLTIDYALNGGTHQSLFTNGTPDALPAYEVDDIEPVAPAMVTADSTAQDSSAAPAPKPHPLPTQPAAGLVQSQTVTGRIGRLGLTVSHGEGSRFYGVALDGRHGVALDNFSMRGSGGQFLQKVPAETWRSFASLRPYDLIVLHYGLNVAAPKQKDYSAYVAKIGRIVDMLKKVYPQASILIVGLGDRDARDDDGQLRTMDGVRELISYQRRMASDHRVAFWNLYQAMGGNGSLARMTAKKQANLDYTHINFAGGRRLATLLFEALMNGKENYNGRAQ